MDARVAYLGLECEQKWLLYNNLQATEAELKKKSAECETKDKEIAALKKRVEELEGPSATLRRRSKSGGKLRAVDGSGEKDRPVPPAGGTSNSKPEQPKS